MISVVVGEMVDRSDLVVSQNPPCSALSQDVLTVFQFHSYILQHEVQDMETHLLHLAREGTHSDLFSLHNPDTQKYSQINHIYEDGLNQIGFRMSSCTENLPAAVGKLLKW